MSDLSNKTILLLVLISIIISLAGIFSAPKGGVFYITGFAGSGTSSAAVNITEEVSVAVTGTVNFYLGRVNAGATNATLDSDLGKYSYDLSVVSAGASPSKRFTPLAYDSLRNVTVIFGGDTDPGLGDSLNDTWEFNGTAWNEITGIEMPPARELHSLVFDSSRNVTVLFGGRNETGISGVTFYNDTWEYDGTSWTLINTANAPEGRIDGAMAFDSNRNVTVLYGGANSTFGVLNDTWEYDGTNWNQATPTNHPYEKYLASLAYDSARGVIVMFGGEDASSVYSNETWEYNGVTWTNKTLPEAVPSGRSGGLAFDSVRNVSVLIMGSGGGSTYFNDTWEYDGNRWMNITDFSDELAALGGSEGQFGEIAFDSKRNSIYGLGGSSSSGFQNTTIQYNASDAGGVVNGSWLFTKEYFGVENDGTVNISVNLTADNNAAQLLGGTNPLFQIKGVVTESGACPNLVTSYTNVPNSTETPFTICPLLKFGQAEDSIETPIKIAIPSDAASGEKSATITFTASKVP